jgi:hypothetical protein
MNILDIEAKLIQKFVKKSKQERYLTVINKPKTRGKFIKELAHFKDLNIENFEELFKDEKKIIIERIKKLGNLNECYIVSENSLLDGKKRALRRHLRKP